MTWGAWNSTSITARSWRGLKDNGVALVAVGYNSAAALVSEDDGATFAEYALPSVANWVGLHWDPVASLWVTWAYNSDKAATSPDGMVWTERTLPSASAWTQIVQSGSRITLVANSESTSAYSTNGGITWAAGAAIGSGGGYDTAQSATRQVAVSSSGAGGSISTDGFQTYTATAQTYAYGAAVYDEAHDVFIGISSDAANYGKTARLANDGSTTWTAGGDLPTTTAAVYDYSLFYYDGRVFAVSQSTEKIASSSDGALTWVAERDMPVPASWRSNAMIGARHFAVNTGVSAFVYWRDANVNLATLNFTEEDDVVAITGNIPNTATLNFAEEDDVVAITGNIPNTATLDFTEEDDVVSIQAAVSVSGYLYLVEEDDAVNMLVDIAEIVETFSVMVRHKTTNAPLTGLSTVALSKVKQESDGYRWDFSDNSFKASPVTPALVLAEVDAVNEPGEYASLVTTTNWDGWINYEATYNDGSYIYSYPGRAYYSNGVEANGSWSIAEIARINAIKNDTATAVLDAANGLETGTTVREGLRAIAAVAVGKRSGTGTNTETFKGIGGDTTRVVAQCDLSGNRTSVVVTP